MAREEWTAEPHTRSDKGFYIKGPSELWLYVDYDDVPHEEVDAEVEKLLVLLNTFMRQGAVRWEQDGVEAAVLDGHLSLYGKPGMRADDGTVAIGIDLPESRTYRTKSGRVLTDADFEALADEAERGYDVSHLIPRKETDEQAD